MTPHPKNPRQNEEAVSQIARSIERFGFTSPIIARQKDKMIIAGHTRWKAAQKIGLSKVPVIFVNLSVVDAELLMIADNKLGEKADWDTDKLSDLLSELREQGEDLDVLGFDDGELEDLFSSLSDYSIDDYEDLEIDIEDQENAVSKTGEVYKLGDHKLYCGDCKDYNSSAKNLIFDPMWQEISDLKNNLQFLSNNYDNVIAFTSGGRFQDVEDIFGSPTWVFVWDCVTSWYFPSRPLARAKFALWYGDKNKYNQEGAFLKSEDKKSKMVRNTRAKTTEKYEYKPHPKGKRLADLYSTPITKLHSDDEHQFSKPFEWIKCLIGNTCSESVFDPFAGSGVTLIASHILGIRWEGCEIDPKYCDLIRKKYAQFARDNNLPIDDGLE